MRTLSHLAASASALLRSAEAPSVERMVAALLRIAARVAERSRVKVSPGHWPVTIYCHQAVTSKGRRCFHIATTDSGPPPLRPFDGASIAPSSAQTAFHNR